MKKILVVVSIFAVLVAVGAGGWWYAADRGLIPGKPNSPRPENFKSALDEYLARSSGSTPRPCAPIGFSSPRGRGFPDMRFDWTPVGFRAVLNAQNDPQGMIRRWLDLLAKQGLLQSVQTTEGAAEYTMTWKGFGESNLNGCFFVASAEREAKIIGFEKKRVLNNVEIYEVTARPMPAKVEAWAQTLEFKERFGAPHLFMRQIDPEAVTYELARGNRGFTVLGERGKQPPLRAPSSEDAAMTAKLAGVLTPDQAKKAAETYLAKMGSAESTACLLLPPGRNEADEFQLSPRARAETVKPAPVSYTFYNLPGREPHTMEGILRGYELMRRLESLGLARSELMNAALFEGKSTLGGVRFDLAEPFSAKLISNPGYSPCYAVGKLKLEDVVSVDQFDASTLRPRFVVRMAMDPVDEDAKRIIDRFGHLARVAAVGVWMSGSLRYADGEVRVENARVHVPTFFPDTSEVNLPVVQVTTPRPGTRGPAPDARAIGFYAIGVYEGAFEGRGRSSTGQPVEGTVTIVVRQVARPVTLYLVSYEPVHWVVTVARGTKLVRVVTSGYHPQRVTAAGATGVEVVRVPYVSVSGASAQANLARAATRQFGVPPVSAQYSYKGSMFEIGTR